jgi:hypothetical protein
MVSDGLCIFCISKHIDHICIYMTHYVDCLRNPDQCLIVFPLELEMVIHSWPETNHSIKSIPTDLVSYCNAIDVACEALETAHKDWFNRQGVCTNQGPCVQFTMMLHTRRQHCAVWRSSRQFTTYFTHFTYLSYCAYSLYLTYCTYQGNELVCFQQKLTMARMKTTGISMITPTSKVYP